MKKETILKVLKYLGVACIGAFIGMGALIGVSSCSNSRSKDETTIKGDLNKHYKKVSDGINIFNNDKHYYFVAKNYSQNGEGVYYQDSITLTNSAVVNYNGAVIESNEEYTDIGFSVVNENNLKRTQLRFASDLDGGVYKLRLLYLSADGGVNRLYIYNTDSGLFNRNNCAFIGVGFQPVGSTTIERALFYLNQFFDIYDLSDYAESYDFNNAFNYNNFYQVTSSFYAQPYSPVVGVTTGDSQYVTTLNVGLFHTGGLVFDSIKVTFARNYNNSYYFETAPNSNEYLQFPTNAVGAVYYYFLQMEYVNSATNFTLMACNRTSYTKNGTPYIQFLPAWASQEYKNLEFQNPISNLKTRSIFNSLSDTNQLNQPIATNNVGLSNVFDLLRLAFESWIPIFNIQIIPGITIGLLMFMPLITGIIILVIWLVKR